MILRAAALALGASLLTAPAAPAAVAGRAAPAIVDQADHVGDVNVFDGGGTKPTTAQRKTIDLERFSVTAVGDGIRLSFRIARITRSRTYDQIVTAQLRTPGKDGLLLDVLANPQGRHATAYVDDTICLADVSTAQRTGTVRVDLPGGCVPHGSGVLRVTTYTQEKNGSGPGFSEDTMRVRGLVNLR